MPKCIECKTRDCREGIELCNECFQTHAVLLSDSQSPPIKTVHGQDISIINNGPVALPISDGALAAQGSFGGQISQALQTMEAEAKAKVNIVTAMRAELHELEISSITSGVEMAILVRKLKDLEQNRQTCDQQKSGLETKARELEENLAKERERYGQLKDLKDMNEWKQAEELKAFRGKMVKLEQQKEEADRKMTEFKGRLEEYQRRTEASNALIDKAKSRLKEHIAELGQLLNNLSAATLVILKIQREVSDLLLKGE